MIKQEDRIKKIFKGYNSINFVNQAYGLSSDNEEVRLVNYVLSQIGEENEEFIRKEFINNYGRKNWYYGNRSKSAYYRNKHEAMNAFIDMYDSVKKVEKSLTETK